MNWQWTKVSFGAVKVSVCFLMRANYELGYRCKLVSGKIPGHAKLHRHKITQHDSKMPKVVSRRHCLGVLCSFEDDLSKRPKTLLESHCVAQRAASNQKGAAAINFILLPTSQDNLAANINSNGLSKAQSHSTIKPRPSQEGQDVNSGGG